jgi:N,N'-diacetyllegionaminate synthase
MNVKIIAEIAQGYEGKSEQALLLARAGTVCGADAVKFQCVYADEIAVPTYKHYELFKSLEMPISVWQKIAGMVHKAKQELIINVGGERSLEVAAEIGADAVKFHATSFFCSEIICEALKSFAKVYFSLGGLSVEEIEWFIAHHNLKTGEQVAFTYGFQASPTPLEKNSLCKLGTLISRFPEFPFGFEDHTDAASPDRLIVPLMALPFGVQHLEKHLTLEPCLNLEDSESALSPTDFRLFVNTVRRLESTLGMGDLSLTDIESDYRKRVLKVTVAAVDLAAGDILETSNTTLKRVPEPVKIGFIRREELYGKRIGMNVSRHTQITSEMLVN